MIRKAASLVKVCAVWSHGVLGKIGGWFKLPVETTIIRIFKEVGERQISQLESLGHKLRGRIWHRANRWGASKVGLGKAQWNDIDSTVAFVYGSQEGAA